MKIYFAEDVSSRIKAMAHKNHWEPLQDHLNEGFALTLDKSRLSISDLSEPSWSPFCIDFLEPQWLLRLKKVQHETQLIKRAIGFKPQDNILIWDATAGLGRDAIIMAHLGYRVIAAERSLILFELLNDAFERAKNSEDLKESLTRLTLIHGDSKSLLIELNDNELPEVIYLDPMYPLSKKSAQPKKEMQILRKLLGPDDNLVELFEIAKKKAKNKLILKNNPRTVIEQKPKHSLESKSVRFDVF